MNLSHKASLGTCKMRSQQIIILCVWKLVLELIARAVQHMCMLASLGMSHELMIWYMFGI